MRGGGGKAGNIEQCATADGEQIRMAVKVMPVNVCMDFGNQRGGIFGLFAALNNDGRTNKLQAARVSGKIIFDPAREIRLRLDERLINYHQRLACNGIGQHGFQNQVGRRKNIFGKEDAQIPADLNVALNDGHDSILNHAGRFSSF